MDTKLVDKVTKEYKKAKHPDVKVGDIVEVHSKIKEGGKERIQVFKGMIIAIKGSGVSKTITVRKISYGVGVEKIWPIYSPNITKIKIVKRTNVKRSKLYYLRDRVGKEALKVGIEVPVEGKDWETEIDQTDEKKDETDGKGDSSTGSPRPGQEGKEEGEKKTEEKGENKENESGESGKKRKENSKEKGDTKEEK